MKRVADQKAGTTKSRKDLITSLLSRIEKQLDTQKTRVTLTDFIRLIQLQRELEQEEQPAEVIVTWKDLSEKQNAVK
jgi:DNA polymerase III sliding clamp (beta) subunit (PCNA family)